MSSNWKQYGGTKNLAKDNNITTHSLVCDNITIRSAYIGTFNIEGGLNVTENAHFAKDVDVSGNVTADNFIGGTGFITNDLSINGNLEVMQNTTLHGDTRLFDPVFLGEGSNSYLYGNPTQQWVGWNTMNPQSTLDIVGTSTEVFNVYSTQPTNRNIIARNQNNHGMVVQTSDISSSLQFFNDTTMVSNTSTTPDAQILYTQGQQQLELRAPEVRLKAKVEVSAPNQERIPEHIYDETAVIYDISNGIYLYGVYNNPTEKSGNALTLVATDTSSVTFLNIVTPDKKGLSIGGGVYPLNSTSSMGTWGFTDTDTQEYVPIMTTVSGTSNVKDRGTIGINTYAPRTNEYALDINGPLHITHGTLTPIIDTSFQIIETHFQGTVGMSVGTPSAISQPFYQNIVYSVNGGQSWSPSNINSGDLQDISIQFNAVYVFNETYAFVGGESGFLYYTSDGGTTWDAITIVNLTTISSIYARTSPSVVGVRVFYTTNPVAGSTLSYIDLTYTELDSQLTLTPTSVNWVDANFTQVNYVNGFTTSSGTQYIYVTGINTANHDSIAKYTITMGSPTYNSPNALYNFNALTVYSSQIIMAVGTGSIYWTSDGGTTWTNNTSIPSTLNSVSIYDATKAVAVGNNSTIVYSDDGFVTWQPVPTEMLNASGNGADFTPFGENWSRVSGGITSVSVACSFDAKYIISIPLSGLPSLSSDYGVTFINPTIVGFDPYYNQESAVCMSAYGQYQLLVYTTQSSVAAAFYSSDYGVTWTTGFIAVYGSYNPYTYATTYIPCCMSSTGQHQYVASPKSDFIGFIIYASHDYGATWSSQELVRDPEFLLLALVCSSSGEYVSFCINDSNIALTEYIYNSTDYGATYTPISNAGYFNSLSMSESGQYRTAVSNAPTTYANTVYTSSDYGITYTANNTLFSSNNVRSAAIAMTSSGKYQTITQRGENINIIYISTDTGKTWNPQTLPPSAAFDIKSCVCMTSNGSYIILSGSAMFFSIIPYAASHSFVSVKMMDTETLLITATIETYIEGAEWGESRQYYVSVPLLYHRLTHTVLDISGASYFSGDVHIVDGGSLFCDDVTTTGNVHINKNIEIDNNALIHGALTMGDNSAIVSVTPALNYSQLWNDWFKNNNDDTNFTTDFYGVASSSTGQYILAGKATGLLKLSSDYGVNWMTPLENDSYVGDYSKMCMSSSGQYQMCLRSLNAGIIFYRSNDFGITWIGLGFVINSFGSSSCCMSVSGKHQYYVLKNNTFFPPPNTYIAVETSHNYGNTFTTKSIYLIDSVLPTISMVCSASGKYTIVCFSGTDNTHYQFNSDDYGETYTQITTNIGFVCMSASASGQFITAISNNRTTYENTVYTSTDYGVTFIAGSILFTGTGVERSADVTMSASGQYQTVVQRETTTTDVYVSEDYGITWTTKTLPAEIRYSVCMSSDARYTVVGGESLYFSELCYSKLNVQGCQTAIGHKAGSTGQQPYAVALGYQAGSDNQGTGGIAIGFQAGSTGQQYDSIALGTSAGAMSQSERAIAIGYQAGQNEQQAYTIAIGFQAGTTGQQYDSIALGTYAGAMSQSEKAIAIGYQAGQNEQQTNSIAIGFQAGTTGQQRDSIALGTSAGAISQSATAIAIGYLAGQNGQQTNAIAIGFQAGTTGQQNDSIALGTSAGQNGQNNLCVALGFEAGTNNQGTGGASLDSGNSIAIGINAGQNNQHGNSIAIGKNAGQTDQFNYCIAIGESAGSLNQGNTTSLDLAEVGEAIALGYQAGSISQGYRSVAIGREAGYSSQNELAVAIGYAAGSASQGTNAVALGNAAGRNNQQMNSVSIGSGAGGNSQGTNAIAIGQYAGETGQHANSIALNASGVALNTTASGLFINPIRKTNINGVYLMAHDYTATNEIIDVSSLTMDTNGNLIVLTNASINGTMNTTDTIVSGTLYSNTIQPTGPTGNTITIGAGVSNIINIGNVGNPSSSYSDTINIGGQYDNIHFAGNITSTAVNNLQIINKTIGFNVNSPDDYSSAGSGIVITDNNNAEAAYIQVDLSMNGFVFKAPNKFPSLVTNGTANNVVDLNINSLTTTLGSGILMLQPSGTLHTDSSFVMNVANLDISNIFIRDATLSTDKQQIVTTSVAITENASFNGALTMADKSSIVSVTSPLDYSQWGNYWSTNIVTDADTFFSMAYSSTGQYVFGAALNSSAEIPLRLSVNYGVDWTTPNITGFSIYANNSSTCMSASGQYLLFSQTIAGGTQTTTLYQSSDYGYNFTTGFLTIHYSVYGYVPCCMSASGEHQYIASSKSDVQGFTVYASHDFGATWSSQDFTRDPRYALPSLVCSASGKQVSFCINGTTDNLQEYIYNSTDFGATYTPISTSNAGYDKLSMSASGQYVTAIVKTPSTFENTVYTSTDYGITFTAGTTLFTDTNGAAVTMSASGQYQTAIQLTGTGTNAIYISSNFGTTWSTKTLPTTEQRYSLCMSADAEYTMVGGVNMFFSAIPKANINVQGVYTGIGHKAGTGQQSYAVALGYQAGNSSQGTGAIAIGNQAGYLNQGENAVSLGTNFNQNNQGQSAISIGHYAGENSQGISSIAIGASSGNYQNQNAIAIGEGAGISQGTFTIAIGYQAGQGGNDYSVPYKQNQYGIALGYQAGQNQGTNSVAIGCQAGKNSGFAGLTGGCEGTVAIGYQAGQNGQQTNAIAIGFQAGTTGQKRDSIAFGTSAGAMSQSSGAVAIGYNAGAISQSATAIAIGYNAGQNGQKPSCVALGLGAGTNNQGIAGFLDSGNSIAIGSEAGQNNQYGNSIAIGKNAGQTNQYNYCIAIGELAGSLNQGYRTTPDTDGGQAIALGYEAGSISQGFCSVAIGKIAGYNNQCELAVAIGNAAGRNNQQMNSVSIGSGAGGNSQGTNAIAIGSNAGETGQHANSIVLNASGVALNTTASGVFINPIRQTNINGAELMAYDTNTNEIIDVSSLTIDTGGNLTINKNAIMLGNVAIGIPTPFYSYNLDVSGTVRATSFNATSDYRIKSNVHNLNHTFSVDYLRPIHYFNQHANKEDIGFLAHEVQEHYPYLVSGQKDGEEHQSLNYNGIMGILVKDVKECRAEIRRLNRDMAILLKDFKKRETEEEIKKLLNNSANMK